MARNAAILAATSVFCRIGSLAVVPLILRAFTPVDYGLYSAAFAYAGLLGMLAYLGMNQIVVRDISRGERPRGWVVFHCAALRLMLLLPAGGVLAVLGYCKGFSPTMWALAWVAFGVMALDAISGAIKASMQGTGRFGSVARVDIVRKSTQWVMAVGVIVLGAGIVSLACGVMVAAALALASAWVIGLTREDFDGVGFQGDYARRMLRLAAPMGVSAAFVAALDNADIWLLDWLKGASQVAVYKAANVFKPAFVAQAVVWALMPLAFRLAKENRRSLAKAGATAGRFLLIAGTAAAILFACGAGEIVHLLAGEKYQASTPVFRVMGMTLPFVFVSFLYLHLLTAVDRQILAVFIFAGGLGVNVAVDLALIPSLGPLGAMFGTLSAQVLMAAASFAVVWRVVGRPFERVDLRVLAALGGAISAAILAQKLSIADMGTGAILVLAALLLAFRAVTRRDVTLLKKVFVR